MEQIMNPFEEIRRWFTLGNFLFLACVFIGGWFCGIISFLLLISKFVH